MDKAGLFTQPLFCVVILTALVSTPEGPEREKAVAGLEDLPRIGKTYGIEILTTDPGFPVSIPHGVIDGKPGDRGDQERYARLFAPEFTIYPVEFVKRSHLKRVIFCTDLAFNGQRRNAIPDFQGDTLYLEINRGSESEAYLRAVLHHEFFHMVDYRDDGRVYEDAGWASLNAADFQYGSGGRNAQGLSETGVLTEKFPGFLNHYSTTGVEEDKAEIFAHLIVNPALVEGRVEKDAVLRSKVQQMRELLVRSCPDMNDTFWEGLRTKKR